ncbi:MAG: LamB/YcsF family protein [Ahniella sp.]|nr:LamB/YcsF family protein [Ahniella sp.]
MNRFEINADLGEHEDGGAVDAELMPWIQRANIACGGHAVSDTSMRLALTLAKQHHVLVGAHPSYPDREGFGRTELGLPLNVIIDAVRVQILRLLQLAAELGVRVDHVKPHGALYNRAAKEPPLAEALVAEIQSIDPELALLGLADSAMAAAARKANLRFIAEAFIDRAYEPTGLLRPRGLPGAVLNLEQARAQAESLRQGEVTCADGSHRVLRAQSFCVHGDGREAAVLLASLTPSAENIDNPTTGR